MRILFLEDSLSSKRGGMELSMYEQCVQLAQAGHDVTIGHVDGGDLLPAYEAAGVRAVRMSRYAPLRRELGRDTAGLVANFMKTAGIRPQVVVANWWMNVFFGAALSATARIPVLCHCRLNAPDGVTLPNRWGLGRVSRFVAVSEFTRQTWIDFGIAPEKVTVVHDGVDLERFRPAADGGLSVRQELGIAPDEFVVYSGGRIDRAKNLETVIDAFAQVRDAGVNARLLLAGVPVDHGTREEGERYLRSLHERADARNVSDRILWLGHRADVERLYAAADVAMLAGRTPEPFGRVTCEALACGRPMVTPRQGGSIEILSRTERGGEEFEQLMYEPGDTQAASERLLSLVGWRARDPELSRRAREHVAPRFGLDKLGARLEALLLAEVGRRSKRTTLVAVGA